MTIKDIELFHGVVFTKLLRSERPISLKMFEFNSDTSTAAYLVNDEVALYVKHSKTPRDRKRKGYECVWHFNFNNKHLKEVLKLKKEQEVFVILICGDTELNHSDDMQVCLLYPQELTQCIDLQSIDTQVITVANVAHGKLRVWGPTNSADKPKNIEKHRLENWDVPGN